MKVPFFTFQQGVFHQFDNPLETPPIVDVLVFDEQGVLHKEVAPIRFDTGLNGLFTGVQVETSNKNGFIILHF